MSSSLDWGGFGAFLASSSLFTRRMTLPLFGLSSRSKQKIHMPRYRVLTISAVGDIVRARHFVAADDTEAIERATADREALLRLELWKGVHLVHALKSGQTTPR